uniref:Uncharacterized protein n=1 Tax=Bionectria ochroleuca TaxID=29856 RepID=A0A8H7NK46_BIOOC
MPVCPSSAAPAQVLRFHSEYAMVIPHLAQRVWTYDDETLAQAMRGWLSPHGLVMHTRYIKQTSPDARYCPQANAFSVGLIHLCSRFSSSRAEEAQPGPPSPVFNPHRTVLDWCPPIRPGVVGLG